MNEHDSERILHILATMNYVPTEDPREADLMLINTCSVREKSEQKCYSLLGRLKKLRKNPDVLVGVGGCVAQHEGGTIISRAPFVNFVFGTGALSRLPDLIEQAHGRNGERKVDTELMEEPHPFEPGAVHIRAGQVTAYVTIMRGCNNFCSFCIVPYVRGRERSRPLDDVVDEVTLLVEQGVKEVTLLGQNVNSYCPDGFRAPAFPALLRRLQGIEGLKRIRFTTSHPKDLSPDLIACFSELDIVCSHFHLPLQSGSDRILKRMNRRYTCTDYLQKVEQLRAARPDISLTTDLIVGFPGEREEDFQKTLSMVQEVQFDEFFSFKYSDRPLTRACGLPDKIEEPEKSRRLSVLQELQKSITMNKNSQAVGQCIEVLVEGRSKRDRCHLSGRSATNKVVNFEGPPHVMGELVQVEITAAHAHSLQGRLC